jgi:hypothetical protein
MIPMLMAAKGLAGKIFGGQEGEEEDSDRQNDEWWASMVNGPSAQYGMGGDNRMQRNASQPQAAPVSYDVWNDTPAPQPVPRSTAQPLAQAPTPAYVPPPAPTATHAGNEQRRKRGVDPHTPDEWSY